MNERAKGIWETHKYRLRLRLDRADYLGHYATCHLAKELIMRSLCKVTIFLWEAEDTS